MLFLRVLIYFWYPKPETSRTDFVFRSDCTAFVLASRPEFEKQAVFWPIKAYANIT